VTVGDTLLYVWRACGLSQTLTSGSGGVELWWSNIRRALRVPAPKSTSRQGVWQIRPANRRWYLPFKCLDIETGHAYSGKDIPKEIPATSANRKTSKKYKNPPANSWFRTVLSLPLAIYVCNTAVCVSLRNILYCYPIISVHVDIYIYQWRIDIRLKRNLVEVPRENSFSLSLGIRAFYYLRA
jgi:hypothetical protein